MAIGTTAAIIGSAVVGAGASILGSKSASKAAGKAADAQSQAAAEAAQVQREMYQQNVQLQQPWINTGRAAMGQINALLGLGGGGAPAPATGAPATGTPVTPAPTGQQTVPLPSNSQYNQYGGMRRLFRQAGNGNLSQQDLDEIMQNDRFPQDFRNQLGQVSQQYAATQNGVPQVQDTNLSGTPTATTAESANDAYERFKQYTGYQTRLDEANRGFNSAYAARGTLQSGAALTALARMNQDYASNEFGNYMGYLGNQQQLGAGATNALSGVGTNYGNNMANIAMQNGNNQANAAIARGNAQMGMIQGIGGAIGTGLGAFAFPGSSFRF